MQKAVVQRRTSLTKLGDAASLSVHVAGETAATSAVDETATLPQALDMPVGHPPIRPGSSSRGCPVMIKVGVLDDPAVAVSASNAHMSSSQTTSTSDDDRLIAPVAQRRVETAPAAAAAVTMAELPNAIPEDVTDLAPHHVAGAAAALSVPSARFSPPTALTSTKSALRGKTPKGVSAPVSPGKRVSVAEESRFFPPPPGAGVGDVSDLESRVDLSPDGGLDSTAKPSMMDGKDSVMDGRESGVRFAGEPGGERSSYASSKRSATRRTQDRLRRLIMSPQQELLPALKLMSLVGHAISALAVTLGLIIVIFVLVRVNTYSTTLTSCMSATRLMMDGVMMAQHARRLVLSAVGWLPLSSTSDAALRAELLRVSAEFDGQHRALYAFAQTIGQGGSYTNLNVNLTTWTASAVTAASTQSNAATSLLEAGLAYVSNAQEIARTGQSNLTLSTPALLNVLENGLLGGSIHDSLNGSIWTWFAQARSLGDQVDSASVAAYASVCVILALVAGLIVLPIVIAVDRARDAVVQPFVALPTIVPAKLRALTERHLKRVAAMDNDSDEDDEDDDSGDERERVARGDEGSDVDNDEVDWARLLQVDSIGRSSRSKREKGPDSRSRKTSITGAAGSTAKSSAAEAFDPATSVGRMPASRLAGESPSRAAGASYSMQRGPRATVKSSRSIIMLAVRFTLPLLLVLAFFTAIYATTVSASATSRGATTIALVAANRALEVRETYMLLRTLVSSTEDGDAVFRDYSSVNDIISRASYHHRLLMFGAPSDPSVSVANRGGTGDNAFLTAAQSLAISSALYGDACPGVQGHPDPYSTIAPADCRTFDGALLTHGLHGALAQYIADVQSLADRRLIATVPIGSASGVGNITIAGVTKPYSIPLEMSSPIMSDIATLGVTTVSPGFLMIGDMYSSASDGVLTTLVGFLVGWLVVFLAFFLAFQYFVFQPRVIRTNKDIKDQRVMLLLLPHQVVAAVPALQAMMQGLLDAEEKRATGWRA